MTGLFAPRHATRFKDIKLPSIQWSHDVNGTHTRELETFINHVFNNEDRI